MPRLPTPAEMRTGDLVTVLVLNWGGEVYHLATEAVTITDGSDTLTFDPTLEADEYTESFEYFMKSASFGEVGVSFVLEGLDIAARAMAGLHLDEATAEVAIIVKGLEWNVRRRLVIGTLDQPSYGGVNEAVIATVAPQRVDSGRVGDPIFATNASIDEATIQPQSLGRMYPVVFGRPGLYETVIDPDTGGAFQFSQSAVPGVVYNVDASAYMESFVMMGHHSDIGAQGNLVRVYSPILDDVTVSNGYDKNGRPVTFGTMGTVSSAHPGATDYTWSFVDPSAGSGDGFGVLHNGAPVRSIRQLVSWLLTFSSRNVDWAQLDGALASLPDYEVAGYIDEVVSPQDFIIDNILPLFSLSITPGPNGIKVLPVPVQISQADAVDDLYADEDIYRVGNVQYDRGAGQIYSAVIVQAGRAPGGSDYGITVRIDNPAAPPDGPVKTIKSDILRREADCRRVGEDFLRLSRRRVLLLEYNGRPSLAWHSAGNVVLLTDPELSLSSRPAIISEVRIADEQPSFSFIVPI